MKIKTFILIIISCLLTIVFSSCDSDSSNINNENINENENNDVEDTVYTINEMTIVRDELSIYAKLYIPNKDEIMPAVIMSHSAMLTSNAMNSYAIEFAKRGYIACAFDFCGGSSSSKSSDIDMTIFTEVLDLKAVIDEIIKLDNVDSSNILLFGTSQGGLVSALVANDYADKINKMILLYPAFNIPEQVQGLTYESYYSMLGYSEEFIDSLQDYDAYEHISNFTNKVLIIHGTSDTTVDIKYSEKAVEVYNDCVLKTIVGANHGFNSDNTFGFGANYDSIVWEYIDEFLAI